MLGAPQRLRCEYRQNPLGIDVAQPRLSWCINDPRPAEIQTAYHLLAASSRAQLDRDIGDIWDTDRVAGQQTLNIEYRGRPLVSGERVWWKVRSFDSDGLPSPWSEPEFFELGLLAASDWQGQWISAPVRGSATTPAVVPLLRRSFDLPVAPVVARLRMTAQGLYCAQLNGHQVASGLLTPPWTDYGKRVGYQTYDVTELLKPGENVLGALLADGWYAGEPGLGPRQQYGPAPRLYGQLDIELETGEVLRVGTDQFWRWQPSWILQSDVIRGESCDGRQRLAGWSAPGLDTAHWQRVVVHPLEQPVLEPSANPGLRVLREVLPTAPPTVVADPLQPTRRRYDFGEALFGHVRLGLDAAAGVAVRLRYGLEVTSEGELVVQAGVDHYTTSGEQGEQFVAVFAVHGFRYVEVCADLPAAALESVTAQVVGWDVERTGHFSCDHQLLNNFLDGLGRAQQALLQHFPMAGITATERLGYTSAGRNLLGANVRQLDVTGVYRKWLEDFVDAQLPDGGFPPIVPAPPASPMVQSDGGAGWSNAFIDCAWGLYRHFGDRQALERCYGPLRKQLAGMQRRFPNRLADAPVHPLVKGYDQTPGDIVATARYFQSAKLAARIAGVLGRIADLEGFEDLAQSIRSAFRRRFVTTDGRIVGDTATAYTLALELGLLDEPEHQVAFERLLQHLQGSDELSFDPAHVPYLLQVLTRNGRLDLAYQWLLHACRGRAAAGSLGPGAASSLATISEWLYSSVAGLDLDADLSDTHNAYRHVVIRPRPPMGVGFAAGIGVAADIVVSAEGAPAEPPLRWVSASLDSVNGRYACSWEITEEAFELRVLIPGNCGALVILPDDSEHQVVSGEHEFRVAFAAPGDGIPILREMTEAS